MRKIKELLGYLAFGAFCVACMGFMAATFPPSQADKKLNFLDYKLMQRLGRY